MTPVKNCQRGQRHGLFPLLNPCLLTQYLEVLHFINQTLIRHLLHSLGSLALPSVLRPLRMPGTFPPFIP